MLRITIFLLVLSLISVVATQDKRAEERSWARRLFEALESEDAQLLKQARRNHLSQNNDDIEDEVFSNRRAHHNSMEDEIQSNRRAHHNSMEDEVQSNRRAHHNSMEDEIQSNRRANYDSMEDGYLELRARGASKSMNTGPVITLQNRALMNTRLRVLYTDQNCSPFLAESGLLMTLQTKSVTLPIHAQNIKVIVEKDMFAEHWRVAYNGTLNDFDECIRITGATFSSTIKPCE